MLNKVILMGRLTKDPELRYTGSGKAVCSFAVAVNNGCGENRQTDFINCVAWQSRAEFLSKYFSKGSMVIVVGRLTTRSWQDNSGKTNHVTEVTAEEVSFGETKRNRESGSMEFEALDIDDDMPF